MNIVLVHGILGFSNLVDLGPVQAIPYFRGIKEHFEAKGHHVLPVTLNKTAGVETRAGQLADQLTAGLGPGGPLDPAQLTHIIAHSMGGLDSRWVLSPDNPDHTRFPIRSLTMIGSPHLGSPIADAVDNDLTPVLVKRAIGVFLAQWDISLEGLRALRTDTCSTFSANCGDRKGVDYFCISGVGRVGLFPGFPKTRVELEPLHEFISFTTGEDNDGLVTRTSSHHGTQVGDWHADHIDEIGYPLSIVPPVFGHLPKYDEILARLVLLV
jgi:triacylglycerol lipase